MTIANVSPDRWKVSLLLSVCGHAAAGALLFLNLNRPQPPAPPMEIVVSLVEAAAKPAIIVDEATAVEKAPQAAQSDDPPAKPLPTAEPPHPRQNLSNAFRRAQDLFASAALADPRNAQAREALRTLAADERRIQLCNLEAMEQLRRASHVSADMVAPYAFQDLAIRADEIIADGAAVRAGRDWRRLRYRCAIGTAAEAPSDFVFALGDDIPKAQWSDHFLTADQPADE
ncbi:DUF930 domain-containing protein [Rhizobium sp. FKL33]|uniref:DUF930 domain-containing protein n=1 Tax=Rhizobium sp. FKL33 TaxID=2562307 RepID=UPI001484FFD0|nr:DUF930 domain-containing protein [Rhizobium sp. FKL33]